MQALRWKILGNPDGRGSWACFWLSAVGIRNRDTSVDVRNLKGEKVNPLAPKDAVVKPLPLHSF